MDRTGLSYTVLVAVSYEVTPPVEGWWVGSTIRSKDSTGRCVSDSLGQTPPGLVMWDVGDV